MLRRGYDAYMHYTASGTRRLMFRFPAGLPCSRKRFQAFLPENGVLWHADPSPRAPRAALANGEGKTGGILEISMQADDVSAIDKISRMVPMAYQLAMAKNMLIEGDLRPLYVAWLACNRDETMLEPPVPAGLGNGNSAVDALANFYGVRPGLMAAAARESPEIAEPTDDEKIEKWLAQQSAKELRPLVRLFVDDWGCAFLEFAHRIRSEVRLDWPLAKPTRTLAQLARLPPACRSGEPRGKERSRELEVRIAR